MPLLRPATPVCRIISDGPVRIEANREAIVLTAPSVFRDARRSLFDEFTQRLAASPLVCSIDLDRPLGRVAIRIDVELAGPADALEDMARALLNCGAVRPSASHFADGVTCPDHDRRADCPIAVRPRPFLPPDRLEILDPGAAIAAIRVQPMPAAASAGAMRRPIVQSTGLKRAANLAAAGGCFVMSFVGLATPGIPTVPFVLATSYFLVRSSPALDARLKRSRLFGSMLRDWEAYGGIRRSTKVKIVVLTFAIMAVTVIVGGQSWPIVLVACAMGALGTSLILRLPTVPANLPA